MPLEVDQDDGEGRSGPVIAGGTTPDYEVENKQRLEDLRGGFHGLSENHHRIIVMCEFAATNAASNAVSNVGRTASNVTNTASNTLNNTVSSAGGLIPGH